MRRLICAFVVRKPRRQVFSRRDPLLIIINLYNVTTQNPIFSAVTGRSPTRYRACVDNGEYVAVWNYPFADARSYRQQYRGQKVMAFWKILTLRQFCLDRSDLNLLVTFSVQFWLESGQRKYNDHACFLHSFTLEVSLGSCLNTLPSDFFPLSNSVDLKVWSNSNNMLILNIFY